MSVRFDELADHVFDQIDSVVKTKDINKILVGYSGGLDSTVLLHIVAKLRDRIRPVSILAIHVDHGIHPNAQQWVKHCQSFCNAHGLKLKVSKFSLDIITTNREAIYRQARYEAFADELSENRLLLTAHHQRDQAETVLFNLFRGAGVSGLRGMKALREFDSGFHLRPLMSVSPQCLSEYARHHKLSWIDDPSNHDQDFDRNYIRHELLPLIEKRWPAAQTSISRSADLLAQAELILNERAQQDITLAEAKEFPGVIKNQYLSVLTKSKLNMLSIPRLSNALRHWLEQNSSIIPSSSQINQIIRDLCANGKKSGLFEMANHQIRAYKDYLYLMPSPVKQTNQLSPPEQNDDQTYKFKDLSLKIKFSKQVSENLEFRLPEQGERVRMHGQTKTLKKLYQESEIPPWERKVLPLIYLNNQFITIAGTAINSDYESNVILS